MPVGLAGDIQLTTAKQGCGVVVEGLVSVHWFVGGVSRVGSPVGSRVEASGMASGNFRTMGCCVWQLIAFPQNGLCK